MIKPVEHFNFLESSGDSYATRRQLEELYKTPKKTLADAINKLKHDNMINGAKIRLVAQDGKKREQEVYTIQESIFIGFRLRSDIALELQRYAAHLMIEKMNKIADEKKMLELELSYAWNKSDVHDLYN